MGATYRVMLDGMAADRGRDEVAAHLVRIFNLSEDSARALLDSRGVVIKDGLDREGAMRVRSVLERAGCVAVVNRELSPAGAPRSGTPPGSPAMPGASAPPPVTFSSDGPGTSTQPPAAPARGGMATAYLAIGAALALMTALVFAIAK